MESITIPGSVGNISSGIIAGSSIKNVTISEGVTSIGENAFSNYYSLKSIKIPESVTSIGESAFRDCGLTSVTIPQSVTSIGRFAFRSCNNLRTAIIGAKSIGTEAFWDCGSLTDVTILKGVESIGVSAFWNCSSLKNVAIQEGVKTIGDSAFENCSSLTSVTIPEGVTRIGQNAFRFCSSLKSVTVPKSVTSIGLNPFLGCGKLTIYYAGSQKQWKKIIDRSELDFHKTYYLADNLKKVSLSSVKSKAKKTVEIKWKRNKEASGYIIQCATDKNFKKNKKQVTIGKNKTTSTTVKKLKGGKKYYVRICTYTKVDKSKIQGDWSKVKTVKVKK